MKRILAALVLATLHCAAVRPFFSQSVVEEKVEELREKGACWGTGYVGKELRENHPSVAADWAKGLAKGDYINKCQNNSAYDSIRLYSPETGIAIVYSSYYDENKQSF